MWTRDALVVLLGYLLGSIPFAHMVTRWRKGFDIREVGEGNVGGRNVWHVVGPGWGSLVTFLDAMKGTGTVLLARALGVSTTGAFLAGPAVILGHAFPLFLHFRGGKGVSTTAGVVLAWMPLPSLAAVALFGIAQLILRDFNRSIVVGLVALVLLPLAFRYPWTMSLYTLALLLVLALKKVLDMPHERRVWASSGWSNGGQPGLYREEIPAEELSEEVAEGREQA